MCAAAISFMAYLRAFFPEDYPGVVALKNALYPDRPVTVEELREEDSVKTGEEADFSRWVAYDEGTLVGACTKEHNLWDFHPSLYEVSIEVLPSHQGSGLGSCLYRHVLGQLPPRDPLVVTTWVRASCERSVRFVLDRGFSEHLREAVSRVDLATWDPAPFIEAEGRLAETGITIRSLSELALDPRRDEKLYELERETCLDIPGCSSIPSFEAWKQETLQASWLMPDGYFVAVHGEEYVGSSYLAENPVRPFMEIVFTAVRRPWRNRGIATVLKARGMAYAQSRGCPSLETYNEVRNESILRINRALGFSRKADWVLYQKEITGKCTPFDSVIQ